MKSAAVLSPIALKMEEAAAKTFSRKQPLDDLKVSNQSIPEDWDGRKPLQGAFLIELRRIEADADQPRHVFDPKLIEEMKLSILEHGILQPITVRYVAEKNIFRIMSGERRYRGAIAAGLTAMPCWVQNPEDRQILPRQIVENWQRAELDPYEISDALKRLQDEYGYTQADMVRLTGKPKSEISRLLSIQRTTPDVQAKARTAAPGTYTRRHLVAIAGLRPEDQQEAVAAMERQGLTALEVERMARAIKAQRSGLRRPAGHAATFRYTTAEATVVIAFRRAAATSDDIKQVLDEVSAQLFTARTTNEE